MSDIRELNKLLGKRLRVYLNHGGGVHAEGEVIGYYDYPMLCIRQDDGTQVAVPSNLRREIVDPLPPEPPEGAYVLDVYGRAWQRETRDAYPECRWRSLGTQRVHSKWKGIAEDGVPARLYQEDEQPLRRAAKELRDNGPTVPKFYPDDRERVANWLDSLADLYEGGRDDR